MLTPKKHVSKIDTQQIFKAMAWPIITIGECIRLGTLRMALAGKTTLPAGCQTVYFWVGARVMERFIRYIRASLLLFSPPVVPFFLSQPRLQ